MKANELRIGNWYENQDGSFKPNGRYSQVEEPKDLYLSELMLPIPLTKEWLEFLGFTKRMNHYEKEHALWISLDGVIKGEPSIWIHGNYCPAIKISYVHQLQNLYFAVTGEDFTTAPQLSDLQHLQPESKP